MIIVYPNYFNFPVIKEINDDGNDLHLREADDYDEKSMNKDHEYAKDRAER